MQYIMGVGSPIPSHEAELFSYMPYVIGVAMAAGQFAKCQSDDFFCVCANLPSECHSADFDSLEHATLLTAKPMLYV